MIDLTPLDVRNKRGDFKKIMRGYDPPEVDVFLELVAERLEVLVRENMKLRERTTSLQDQVAQQADREQAVQNALVTAQELRADIQAQSQREAEHVVKEADVEAKRLVADAEAEAKRLVTDAESEVRRLLMEADDEVRSRLRGIERRVDQAEGALEGLERSRARFLTEYRSLLKRELDVVRSEEGRVASVPEPVERSVDEADEATADEAVDDGVADADPSADEPPKPRVGPLAAVGTATAVTDDAAADEYDDGADADDPAVEPPASVELSAPVEAAVPDPTPGVDEATDAPVRLATPEADDAAPTGVDAADVEVEAREMEGRADVEVYDATTEPASPLAGGVASASDNPGPEPWEVPYLQKSRDPVEAADLRSLFESVASPVSDESAEVPPPVEAVEAVDAEAAAPPEVFDLPDHFGRKSDMDTSRVVREATERLQSVDVSELGPEPTSVDYELRASVPEPEPPSEVQREDGSDRFPDVPDLETVLAEAGIEEVVPPPVDRSPPPLKTPNKRPDNLIRFDPDHKRPNEPGR